MLFQLSYVNGGRVMALSSGMIDMPNLNSLTRIVASYWDEIDKEMRQRNENQQRDLQKRKEEHERAQNQVFLKRYIKWPAGGVVGELPEAELTVRGPEETGPVYVFRLKEGVPQYRHTALGQVANSRRSRIPISQDPYGGLFAIAKRLGDLWQLRPLEHMWKRTMDVFWFWKPGAAAQLPGTLGLPGTTGEDPWRQG